MSLIEELYDPKSVQLIRSLYKDDVHAKAQLYDAFAHRIMERSDIFLQSKPLDILCILCSTAKFAESKEECYQVAIIVHKGIHRENPLPYILDDHGFLLAEKTLVALSFFRAAMDYRNKYSGAPTSDFYRKASKLVFEKNGYYDIAEHHERWESFLGEMFI